MKIIQKLELVDFNAWSGAVSTKEEIIKDNKSMLFEELIDDLYPDGLTDTQLNDILWFESEWIGEQLDIKELKEEE